METEKGLTNERDKALAELGELKTALRDQIAKQVETEQALKSQCQSALAEVADLKTMLRASDAAVKEQAAKQADTEQGLKTERDGAFAEVAELRSTIEALARSRSDPGAHPTSQPMKRWLSPVAVGALLLAAVLGGTLVSVWRSPDSGGERGADQAKAALAASDAARQTAEAQAADADKARQAASARADDADRTRRAAEAKEDQATAALGRSDKARQDAEAKVTELTVALNKSDKARQDAETKADQATTALGKSEKARQDAETKAAQAIATQVANTTVPAVRSSLFTLRRNMDVRSGSAASPPMVNVNSTSDCERNCAEFKTCNVFAYNKPSGRCYMYSSADLIGSDFK